MHANAGEWPAMSMTGDGSPNRRFAPPSLRRLNSCTVETFDAQWALILTDFDGYYVILILISHAVNLEFQSGEPESRPLSLGVVANAGAPIASGHIDGAATFGWDGANSHLFQN